MATPDLEEELNVLARFIGRAVNVPGDLDALEALTKVKYHIAELETENAIHQQNIETAAQMNQRLEEALLLCIGWGEMAQATPEEIAAARRVLEGESA